MLLFLLKYIQFNSIPSFQGVIFHVERHPDFAFFEQCVTFNFFPSQGHEMAYNLFTISAVYILPLTVIIVVYTLILCEITRKARQSQRESHCQFNSVQTFTNTTRPTSSSSSYYSLFYVGLMCDGIIRHVARSNTSSVISRQ